MYYAPGYYAPGYFVPPANLHPPPNWRHYLCIYDIDNTERVWHVYLVYDVVIGRSPQCYISMPDKSVSRQHCRIYHYSGYIMIENLSRTTPTVLNGQALQAPAALKVGDSIKCGNVTLVVNTVKAV